MTKTEMWDVIKGLKTDRTAAKKTKNIPSPSKLYNVSGEMMTAKDKAIFNTIRRKRAAGIPLTLPELGWMVQHGWYWDPEFLK